MSRRVTKKASNDMIDVDTFKAWLQGVEDMQGDDWCPSLDQWRKIRQKIDLIDGTVEQVSASVPTPPVVNQPSGLMFPPGVRGNEPAVPVFNPPLQRPIVLAPTEHEIKPSDSNLASDGTFQSSFA